MYASLSISDSSLTITCPKANAKIIMIVIIIIAKIIDQCLLFAVVVRALHELFYDNHIASSFTNDNIAYYSISYHHRSIKKNSLSVDWPLKHITKVIDWPLSVNDWQHRFFYWMKKNVCMIKIIDLLHLSTKKIKYNITNLSKKIYSINNSTLQHDIRS